VGRGDVLARSSSGGPPACLLVVLCPERSGSTLLSSMLAGSEHVLAPPELHLLRFETVRQWARGYPMAGDSLAWLCAQVCLGDAGGDPLARFRDARTVDVLAAVLAAAAQVRYVIDKTPAYARRRESLVRAEGLRPRYLWLVRHPLAVALSRRAAARRHRLELRASRPWPYGDLRYALGVARERTLRSRAGLLRDGVRYWRECHQRIGEQLATVAPSRWLRVHYESLVAQPRDSLGELCRWLGVEPRERMLARWANAPQPLRWGMGDGTLAGTRAIAGHGASAWRSQADESLLDAPTLRLMRELEVVQAP